MAATNTLVVTYYLAIEKVPELTAIFPTFTYYVVILAACGIPILISVGYSHWKRTGAYRTEMEVNFESNPFNSRMLVNSEINLKLNLKQGPFQHQNTRLLRSVFSYSINTS